MRFRVVSLLFLALVFVQGASLAQDNRAKSKTVTILQLNDVYQIAPVDRGKRGGLARVATLQKSIRAQSPNTLFLLAGDFISPSVSSRLFRGKQMIDALNASGLDIATFGNHEFDFGPDVLRQRMRESRFDYTSANVIDKIDGKPFGGAHRFIIRDLGGVKVGVFGLVLPSTYTLSNPGAGVRFDDPITVGTRVARQLRRLGADVVIALTHLPMPDDKRLAARADVDLIIGGHEHKLMESKAGHALILKSGSDARNLCRVDITLLPRLRRRGFHIESLDWQAIPVTDALAPDPRVADIVAGYEKQLDAALSEVIGRTTAVLDVRSETVRRRESNLGNFVADCYRQAMKTDVALVNSGGLRSDTTYGPGELTKKDVVTILPFENNLARISITGAHLKRLLEHGVSVAGQTDGRFPQVSGLSFSYDPARPVGSRVTKVEISGKPVVDAASYTMAVGGYLLGGGDGYDLKGATVLVKPEEGPLEPDVVIEAIKRLGTISPTEEGRINEVAHEETKTPGEKHEQSFSFNQPGQTTRPTPSASAAWYFNFDLPSRSDTSEDTIGFSRMVLQLRPAKQK